MAVKKVVKKKSSKPKKGEKYECGECGVVVAVDKECGCDGACGIVCCGEPMKAKKK